MKNRKIFLFNTTLELLKKELRACRCHNLLILLFCSLLSIDSNSQIELSNEAETILIGQQVETYLDPTGSKSILEIESLENDFEKNGSDVINAQVTSSTLWIKLEVKNLTAQEEIFLEIRTSNIDEVTLYKKNLSTFSSEGPYGQAFSFSQRFYNHPHFLFDLELNPNETATYFISVKNADQITLPLQIGASKAILEGIFNYDVANGIYLGIFLVMFMYNVFLYFSTRNKSYISYSVFVLTIGVALFTISGYSFKYVWPNNPWLEKRALVMVSAAIAITALIFATAFLKLKENMPKARVVLIGFITCYLLVFFLTLFGFISIGQKGIFALSISIFVVFGIALHLSIKGIRAAKFYLAAWTLYLIGIVVFLLKDFGVLPYNAITNRMMHFGSALEVVLLSFALGDYVNTLRIEKEQSQKRVLLELQRNEQIIKEQNILLEEKVKTRTSELEVTNSELSVTLSDLKEAQTQLVDAEKMASLGQLTAGIAHEINNPINFVSANVSPLKQDIDDLLSILDKYEKSETEAGISAEQLKEIKAYKDELDIDFTLEEIETLISGIKDGADRTAEIVKGLKNFSRLDESKLNSADLNEGLESTLLILKSKMENVSLVKKLDNLKPTPCLPGKLNQLFMNILDNSIYACNFKTYSDNATPEITIASSQNEENTIISIKDNGIGMTPEVLAKVCEPFFTTKKVGDGTGLGMSIANGIISSHQGDLKISSEINVGTEIIITLPRVINNSIKPS